MVHEFIIQFYDPSFFIDICKEMIMYSYKSYVLTLLFLICTLGKFTNIAAMKEHVDLELRLGRSHSTNPPPSPSKDKPEQRQHDNSKKRKWHDSIGLSLNMAGEGSQSSNIMTNAQVNEKYLSFERFRMQKHREKISKMVIRKHTYIHM